MTSESTSSPPSELPSNPSPQTAPIARSLGWLAVAVLVGLWAYAVYRLGTLWHTNPDYAYGWFVPLLCLALFWERWKQRPTPDLIEASAGPLIVFALLALTILPSCLFLEIIPYWRFAGWAFASAVIGITFCALYLVGGRSWVHHFAFPLLFFLIAVPWPQRLELPLIEKLSHLNAAASTWAANLLGTPAIRQGVTIQTGGGVAGVDEACSGIRSFQATVMVALFLGELFRYKFLRRIFFLISGALLAFACNVVRTTYLVRVCDLQGEAAIKQAHDPAGFTILGVTLVGLLVLAWLLRPRKRRSRRHRSSPTTTQESAAELEVRTRWSNPEVHEPESTDESTDTPSEPIRSHEPGFGLMAAMVSLALWILAVEFGIEAWFRPTESQAVVKGNWSLQLPTQEAGFRELPIADSVRNTLKYDQGKQVEWRGVKDRPWQAYDLRWLPARTRYRAVESSEQARGHSPDICLKYLGMVLQTNLGTQVRQVKGVTLSTTLERFSDRGRPFHVLSCYWESNPDKLEGPASGGTVKSLHDAWHAIQIHDRSRNEKRVLKFGVWGMPNDEEAEAAFRELLERTIRTG